MQLRTSKSLFVLMVKQCAFAVSHLLMTPLHSPDPPDNVKSPSLSATWKVLGPFQIGTREATWGADPLDYQGGFHTFEYDKHAKFRSSLTENGTVTWSLQEAVLSYTPGKCSIALSIEFPEVDWTFLSSIFGWAALQYQAWARGSMTLNSQFPQTIIFYTENILEFWIDNQSYFGGDVYAYRRAPLVLLLDPGSHRIDIRLVRDVRAMGALGEPRIDINLEAQISSGKLVAVDKKMLISDVVDGQLASPFASLPVRNEGHSPLSIWSVRSADDSVDVTMFDIAPIVLIAGQSRPLAFKISHRDQMPSSLSFVIDYTFVDSQMRFSTDVIHYEPKRVTSFDTHKFSFLHPSGIVSYAILRPPPPETICSHQDSRPFPIMLGLHGAGLEADSDLVRHSLDIPSDLCAWILFPNGVTSWGGDDWHIWGIADVDAAIAAIPSWMDNVGWSGVNADLQRWLVVGHSNGGQGTWYLLTHRPDNIMAAAPVSGYMSISSYVPYQFWHEAESRLNSLLHSASNNYKHELLVANLAGIPILQQHGVVDDNVPAYHSRRMNLLISHIGWSSEYNELPNRGHWFEGVMTTPALRRFYHHALASGREAPTLLNEFSIVVGNPGSMGSKCGVAVDQLDSSGQYGRLDVWSNTTVCSIDTSNIHRFHITPAFCQGRYLKSFIIDRQLMHFRGDHSCSSNVDFLRSIDGSWKISDNSSQLALHGRSARQHGSLEAILDTHGHFCLVMYGNATLGIALQISRNLFQYFGADTEIVENDRNCSNRFGTVISIVEGLYLPPPLLQSYPITLDANKRLRIRDFDGKVRIYGPSSKLSAIFLRPMRNEAVELVVYGLDEAGLRQAARLVPMLTGVGQPDFIILGKECSWEGVNGVKAMGFFDHAWNVSRSSFFV